MLIQSVARDLQPASFLLPVVGERYDNADGTSRQDGIRQARRGAPIHLVREPDNRFDPSAVAVFDDDGLQLGYIGADRCGWIGSKIERGLPVGAIVDGVRGDPDGDLPCRLVIRVLIDLDE